MKSSSHSPRIDCFLPLRNREPNGRTGTGTPQQWMDRAVSTQAVPRWCRATLPDTCLPLHTDGIFSTQAMLDMARLCEAEYCLFYHKALPLELGSMPSPPLRVADDTRADLLYADHYAIRGTACPSAHRLPKGQPARRFRFRPVGLDTYRRPESIRRTREFCPTIVSLDDGMTYGYT